MSEGNIIAGKRRVSLNNADRQFLKDALHTEGVLTGDYHHAVAIRQKLGLGPLSGEKE